MAPSKRRKITKKRYGPKSKSTARKPIVQQIKVSESSSIAAHEGIKSFRLFSLPGEIRELIYRHFLVKDRPILLPGRQAFVDFETLQLASKHVRAEVRPIFYRENWFHWCGHPTGPRWNLFLRRPISQIHSLMITVRALDTICWQQLIVHNFLVWLASSDVRLLQGGPRRLSIQHLAFQIQRRFPHAHSRFPQEGPPPGFEDRAAADIDMRAPRIHTVPSDFGIFPRIKSLRSIRIETIKPVHRLWIDKIQCESGCVVEVGNYTSPDLRLHSQAPLNS